MKRAIRWEYLTVFTDYMADEKLNELGAQGWEVVSILPGDEYGSGAQWLFKRERKS